jgi:hypothetical protein
MYTIQRPGFLADFLPKIFRKFPKSLHEPLFSCGVCVSSIWGIFYFVVQYLSEIYNISIIMIPLYLVALAGICVLFDRSIKSFEYNYKYNYWSKNNNYHYLAGDQARDTIVRNFILEPIHHANNIIEIGGLTESIKKMAGNRYYSLDLLNKIDASNHMFGDKYFVLIKGIAYEGDFDKLIGLLSNSTGFIVEAAISGNSQKQINWILEAFSQQKLIKIPYQANSLETNVMDCGSSVNQRIILIKPI